MYPRTHGWKRSNACSHVSPRRRQRTALEGELFRGHGENGQRAQFSVFGESARVAELMKSATVGQDEGAWSLRDTLRGGCRS